MSSGMRQSGATAELTPTDDLLLPFLLEVPDIRGRLARLGPTVDTILTRHDYPEPVAHLLGEMLALTGLLAGMLKFDGFFTLQTKGDGPVPLAVCDVTSDGALRGYAKVDEEKLAALDDPWEGDVPAAGRLFGKGVLAFTVDQGPETERYQGIVELTGPTLADSVLHYFRQSEQIRAGIKLAAGRGDGGWRAGGLLLQELPEEGGEDDGPGSTEEDDWRRCLILMASCRREEILDPDLPAPDLLYRLFHEERVRVFRTRPLAVGCRCSRKNVESVLRSLPREEIESLKVDGEVIVTCEFCNIDYRFDDAAVDRIYAS